jgi:hypothetical protein
MLTEEQIALAKGRVEAVTGIRLPFETDVQPAESGLTVRWDGEKAAVSADGVNALARGFFILSRAVRENVREGVRRQRRHFASCGTMLDMSRNAVMKVEAVRRHIDQLAALGMYLLMLYTEDTFTVPEYPAFGYMLARGATTLWEPLSFKCGMNSHNHAMFAGAASTLMTRLGGISPKAPGYAEIEICPTFPKSLDWAEATRETPRGRVAVKWRRVDSTVELEVEVPPFTPAVLRAPGSEPRPLAPGRQRVVLAAPAR